VEVGVELIAVDQITVETEPLAAEETEQTEQQLAEAQ
jgi:hypothetical protein